jgi:hypothetical protein
MHCRPANTPSVLLTFACIYAFAANINLALAYSPIIGDVFQTAVNPDNSEEQPAPGTGSVSIQSATAANQGPVCSTDAECQSLCPSSDFTQARPELTTAQLEQQVSISASANFDNIKLSLVLWKICFCELKDKTIKRTNLTDQTVY